MVRRVECFQGLSSVSGKAGYSKFIDPVSVRVVGQYHGHIAEIRIIEVWSALAPASNATLQEIDISHGAGFVPQILQQFSELGILCCL